MPDLIYKSPYPPPHVPVNQSIWQFLLGNNLDDAPPAAIILADYENPSYELAYGGLRDIAARDATILQNKYGLKEGDVVCIYAQNSVNWASLAHAVMWAGGCFCGINPLATGFELVHYLNVATPKIIAVDASLLPNGQEALQNATSAPTVILIDDSSDFQQDGQVVYPQSFDRANTSPIEPLDLTSRDNRKQPAGMWFSSGTSGKHKGVLFSHHNLIAQILSVRATNPFLHNARMREVFFPSFAHIYGIVSGLLIPAWVGSYVQAMKKFDYSRYLQRCAEIRATVLRIVPAVAVGMVKDTAAQKLDLSTVQGVMCSGAALPEDVVTGLKKMLAPNSGVLNGYGMSESTICLLREARKDKGASVERPATGMSIYIVDDHGQDVEPGVDGESLVKGPTVFVEYKGNASETHQTKKDGWLHTGDVVRVERDGFFYLTGRKKELIKYKGNQIAPAELESVLLLHPQVADAGVCGVYHKKLETEIPFGFVTIKPDVPVHNREEVLEDVLEFVNARVASYKRFREHPVHLNTLRKNSSAKLLRRHLVAKATELRKRQKKL